MKLSLTTLAALYCLANIAQAAVSPEDASQLGKNLTPWGAIVAGNAEGTIPAYTGGLPTDTRPAGYVADSGHWANPYSDDKPLYVINSSNVDQYANKLSAATVELIKRFPTYNVPVYQSRRSASYPEWVNQNSIANATRCKSIEDGLATEGCFGGVPFPIAQTGNEIVWNAQMRYQGASLHTVGEAWYVDAKGSKVMTGGIMNNGDQQYYNKNLTPEEFAKIGTYLTQLNVYTKPARIVGEGNLQRFFVNPVKTPNATWGYNPGQRRVRRSPDAQYDFPVSTSGGAMLYDEIYMFSGMQDRYDIKYLGKQEMIIPYNNYEWASVHPKELLHDNHPNPDVMRWELHRVNVVELTLKPGQRHVIPKRRIYYDEDIPAAGMAEGWDASGNLAKAIYQPSFQAYDAQVPQSSSIWLYDFATGVYYHTSITGADNSGLFFRKEMHPVRFFTPESLARQSQR